MPVTLGDFLVRFPAFAEVPALTAEAQLSDAWSMLDRASFANDVMHSRAVMLLAAHNLTLTGHGNSIEAQVVGRGFAMDMIGSVSDNGVSVSLGKAEGSTSIYGNTSYGRELSKLIKSSRVRFAVVGGGVAEEYNRSADDGAPTIPNLLNGQLSSENW